MPDRDYYTPATTPTRAKLREQYLAHVTSIKLLGDTPEQAAASAATVLALETRLAGIKTCRVAHIPGLYKMTQPSSELSPGFRGHYLKNIERLIKDFISPPLVLQEMGPHAQEVPLADWKTYLRWQALNGYAPYLLSLRQ
jgi:putative endopeptidase